MAAPDVAAAAAEIAASLTMDEIPVKLRCAICNKLAVNAFRMPCCDQSVCETCQESLTDNCPICLHNPVDKQLCKPNKALRTTIKAFLRKKGIEKEASKKREKVVTLPSTSATPVIPGTPNGLAFHSQMETTPDASKPIFNPKEGPRETTQAPTMVPAGKSEDSQQTSPEAQMDIPRPSIENASDNIQVETLPKASGDDVTESGMGGLDDQGAEQRRKNGELQDQNGQWSSNVGAGQGMLDGTFGFNAMNGGFPNMTSDISQMMQFMPNGMQNNFMGTFPNMMGMPGMGMDPMAMSQGMYGGFGGQGMGLNGMNMGMGLNPAQGAFGGFAGQPEAWITGQDKFNPNAYGGHANGMGGDFGTHAGYGGYNMPSQQGNFNQMHQQQFPNNDFHNGYNGQGFQNRGRGRRGGYYNAGRGRGGYNQVNQANQANYEPFHHQIPPQLQQNSSQQAQQPQNLVNQEQQPSEETKQVPNTADTITSQAADEQMSKELNPGDEDDRPAPDAEPAKVDTDTALATEPHEIIQDAQAAPAPAAAAPVDEVKVVETVEEVKPSPIETFISGDHNQPVQTTISEVPKVQTPMLPPPSPAIPLGPAAHYSQNHSQDYAVRGRGSGRGFYRGASDIRGGYRGRGSGPLPNGNSSHSITNHSAPLMESPAVIPVEPKGLGVEGAPKAPKALRDGLPNTGPRGGAAGGRGFSIVGRASAAAQVRPNGNARSRSPSPSRHRSRSRSRDSRHRSSHHRSHRHRSKSVSEGSERTRRKERHHRRSRKYEDEGTDEAQDVEEPRKRDTSMDSLSKKPSHRSHRNHEKEMSSSSHRHHRDRSKDRDEERRHRRRRSRSPAEEATPKSATFPEPMSPTSSRRKEKDESRKRRDRDEEDRHGDRKRSRRDRSASPDDSHRSSRHSKRDREDKDSSSSSRAAHQQQKQQHQQQQQDKKPVEKSKLVTTTTAAAAIVAPASAEPEKDHHTLEREARNRERLQRELQRREAIEGKGGGGGGPKRRDSKVDGGRLAGIGSGNSAAGAGTSGRRVSYKYEDEESDEARALRVENEREAGRWE